MNKERSIKRIVKNKMSNAAVMACLVFLLFPSSLLPQPKPGDIFREYVWTTPDKPGNQKFLRVGGKLDYRMAPGNIKDIRLTGGNIPLDADIDLRNAVRAEIMVEKVLCHTGTRNLRISVNDNEELVFPESDSIPEPQELYTHQFYPSVNLPLDHLRPGPNNHFSLQVDTTISWPQNLIYGVIVRIYYEVPSLKKDYSVIHSQKNENILQLKLEGYVNEIKSVDYIACYEGPDLDGNGIYTDWHYHFHRGRILNHSGSAYEKPFYLDWNVSWIPDQKKPVLLSARINFNNGLILMVPETRCRLTRNTYKVELCKPSGVEQKWLTRLGEKQEKFSIITDVKKITEARMVFTSWSPGYFNGININDFLVFIKEGEHYDFMQHNIPIQDLYVFNNGINILKTGKTPKYDGAMVHGVEIMWPGIMILVKSKQ